jgi:peptide deformylase
MAVRGILQIGNPILRQRSSKITRFEDGLARLAEDMLETMHDANGVGLAAPQIGVSKRLIVIEMPDGDEYAHSGERFVLCNPEIVKASRETVVGQEGCLSVVGYVGMVERAEQVIVRGQDLKGRKTRVKAEGYLARALQHEIDHLNGVLYVEIAEESSVMTIEEFEEQVQAQQAAEETSEGAIEDASMPI